MNKILVTGDRGYIGSVLVPLLLLRGYEVVGYDTGFFEKNLVPGYKDLRYKKINKDIRKVTLRDLEGFDGIIHLSALSNDPMGELDEKLTEDINFKASIHLARLAKKAGVSRFLFSSSCSIYGIAKNGVVNEHSKVNPLTAYARSKIKTEMELKKLSGKNFFVGLMRNSTVYGFSPRFRNDLVVNNLVTTALAFGEIRIMSDGTPWRPLIDVRDLSNIFIEFLETQNSAINGRIVNIGFSENNFQVKDLVDIVKRELPKCKIIYTGEHGSDSRSYKVEFDLFMKHFPNFKQKWQMNKSVKNLISELKKTKYGQKDFKSGKYTRLSVLIQHAANKKIDKSLYWKK
jgi:nucleoside-diphosphate-sugar epimerase